MNEAARYIQGMEDADDPKLGKTDSEADQDDSKIDEIDPNSDD